MATRSESYMKKQLDDVIECSICREVLNDPRSLPCLHTFCLKCIEGCCKDKLPGDQLDCPLCKRECTIPDIGVSGLIKNFFIEKLKLISELSTKQSQCEVCSPSVSPNKSAIMYCVVCQKHLCESCDDYHKRLTACQSHKCVRIGDSFELNEVINNLPEAICDKHPTRNIELYCFDCKTVVCMMCLVELHQSHKCSDVNKVVERFRSQMTDDVKLMTGVIERVETHMQEVLKERTLFSNQMAEIEKQVCERAEEMKRLIDQGKETLLQELASIKQSRVKHLENVLEEIEDYKLLADSLRKYTEELTNKGTASDIARQTNDLHNKAEELRNCDVIQRAVKDLGSVAVNFCDFVLPSGNMIGHITMKSEPVSEIPSLTQIIPNGHPAVGVTSLGSQLFVLRQPNKQQVEVYDEATFTLQGTLRVDGLSDSEGRLASCAANNCLYVSDYDNDVVFKVELLSTAVTKWTVEGTGPAGLSVNSRQNVLVTCCTTPPCLQEYTTHGSLVRTISLQSDMTAPQHAIELTSGQFLVCHGGESPLHRVCLVDSDGNVGSSYGNTPGSATGQLNEPAHLSVSKDGFILVADAYNNQIVVLDHTLTWSRDLRVSVDGRICDLYSMHYDESRGRLYVGERDVGRVCVFDNVVIKV